MSLKLISTDFDGTLVGFEPDQKHPWNFMKWVQKWRQEQGGIWMLNTGRWIENTLDRLTALNIQELPEWIGCGEREVYYREGTRFVSLEPWNTDCDWIHKQLALEMHEFFWTVRQYLEKETQANHLYERDCFAGMLASNLVEAEQIHQFVIGILDAYPDVSMQRNDLYFRFCHRNYHKGACITEVQRQLGIPLQESFACGDQLNDLPMLHPRIVSHIACPANAIPEVKRIVAEHQGYIANTDFTEGLVEALDYFNPLTAETKT